MSEIQPTMARTVAWLQGHGFTTTDSGDGVTNVEAGMECALPFANVFCLVANPAELVAEADRLLMLVKAVGISGRVEASYSPSDGGGAILALLEVSDRDWLP